LEDFLLGALGGVTEQLATATAGILSLRPWRREGKHLSAQTSENTQFIFLLCFTRAFYDL
jgi:hypothetical protein